MLLLTAAVKAAAIAAGVAIAATIMATATTTMVRTAVAAAHLIFPPFNLCNFTLPSLRLHTHMNKNTVNQPPAYTYTHARSFIAYVDACTLM